MDGMPGYPAVLPVDSRWRHLSGHGTWTWRWNYLTIPSELITIPRPVHHVLVVWRNYLLWAIIKL